MSLPLRRLYYAYPSMCVLRSDKAAGSDAVYMLSLSVCDVSDSWSVVSPASGSVLDDDGSNPGSSGTTGD